MTIDQTFRLLTFLLLACAFGVSGYYRRKADLEGGSLNPGGGVAIAFLRLGALVVLLPLLLWMISPQTVAWARFAAPVWLRWLGFAITAATFPGVYMLFRTIGNNISPSHTTRSDHRLITDGPYRYIRHPLYTYGFLLYLGIGLMASMWWLLAGLCIMCIPLARRTQQEEANLITEFGDEYREYMRQTRRYFPKLRR